MTDAAGRDAEAVSKFVESFAAQLVEAGMQRMPARVFAALLSSDAGVMTSANSCGSVRRRCPGRCAT
jgi:hypothetical protein